MGGYGSSSGRKKEKCYYDTGNNKVTDNNSIAVAEYYINQGKYVAFLQQRKGQKRADLSVEGVHVEVKGMSSRNPSVVADNIEYAFHQISGDNYRYPPETHRDGVVIILSKYSSYEEAYKIVNEGLQEAYRKRAVKGKVKLFHAGTMYDMN